MPPTGSKNVPKVSNPVWWVGDLRFHCLFFPLHWVSNPLWWEGDGLALKDLSRFEGFLIH